MYRGTPLGFLYGMYALLIQLFWSSKKTATFITASFYPGFIFVEQQSFPWLHYNLNFIVCNSRYGACKLLIALKNKSKEIEG